MTPLRFCRDGVLRLEKLHPETDAVTLIPLAAHEAAIDRDAFGKAMHAPIHLEDRITMGEIMENLAPWAEAMSGLAVMDFPAFLEEARAEADPIADCSHISLDFRATIEAVPEYSEPADPGSDAPIPLGTPRHTGRLMFESGWVMTAWLTEAARPGYDGADSIGLSFTPLSAWAHLPVTIAARGVFLDETAGPGSAPFLGMTEPLTRADAPVVTPVRNAADVVLSHKVTIDAPEPTLFDTLIRGLLWEVGFHYSPGARDAFADTLFTDTPDREDAPTASGVSPEADRMARVTARAREVRESK